MTLTELSKYLGYESIPNSIRKALNNLIEDNVIDRKDNKYDLK